MAYRIIWMLGGMMGPIMELAPVTATAKDLSYPALVIMGISILPRPAVSAVMEPLMPAKIMDATTLTWPMDPRI